MKLLNYQLSTLYSKNIIYLIQEMLQFTLLVLIKLMQWMVLKIVTLNLSNQNIILGNDSNITTLFSENVDGELYQVLIILIFMI